MADEEPQKEKRSELSAEAKALNQIARELATIREEHAKPKPTTPLAETIESMRELTGLRVDPEKAAKRAQAARERERDTREKEQAKLYRLVVLIAGVSAIASIASVVVAVISA